MAEKKYFVSYIGLGQIAGSTKIVYGNSDVTLEGFIGNKNDIEKMEKNIAENFSIEGVKIMGWREYESI